MDPRYYGPKSFRKKNGNVFILLQWYPPKMAGNSIPPFSPITHKMVLGIIIGYPGEAVGSSIA